jgi:hypothetical protein
LPKTAVSLENGRFSQKWPYRPKMAVFFRKLTNSYIEMVVSAKNGQACQKLQYKLKSAMPGESAKSARISLKQP